MHAPLRKSAPEEKPVNGVAGLKQWRYDIRAGLLVSLISLPFSLGIAVASGAPPIAGLTSSIIAGLIFPFLGGANVTISGPAAGLAPVLLASMLTLGGGDLAKGYPLLLVVICMAGCVQIVLSLLKAARFCAIFPSSVIEGMLAAIGLLIIVKEIPHLTGHAFEAHEFFGILAEVPSAIGMMNPQALIIGVVCLAFIFALSVAKATWLKVVPPQVLAVALGTGLGLLMGIDDQYRIHLPENPLQRGLVLPNFAGLFADHSLWFTAAATVVTLTLIDGIESLATVMAIDKIDPFHRKSNPNRILLAMGISNICSSVVGGLTIIPGGVKSTTCILAGGRTLWANFYNAVFLLVFLLLACSMINLIPFAALAAVLIFTGYKLCQPSVWKHVTHVGREQCLVFAVTVLTTLYTDLLVGIGCGIAAKLLVNVWFASTVDRRRAAVGDAALARRGPAGLSRWFEEFSNPVTRHELTGDAYHVYFGKPLVCFNSLHVSRELSHVPPEARAIFLHLTDAVTLVDHTSCDNLIHYAEEHNANGGARVEIVGMERMCRRSEFATCMRLGLPDEVREDAASPAGAASGLLPH
ncbi:MAG TPA: SulP family inorganic anion transporter [Pirellulales bacterium]|nr:SulP family inorganic anion transporter [Pirellulales bacterium]